MCSQDIKTKMGETSEGGLGHRHTFAIDAQGDGQTIEAIGAPNHTHKIVAYEVKPVAAEPNTGLYVHAIYESSALEHWTPVCSEPIIGSNLTKHQLLNYFWQLNRLIILRTQWVCYKKNQKKNLCFF